MSDGSEVVDRVEEELEPSRYSDELLLGDAFAEFLGAGTNRPIGDRARWQSKKKSSGT
ncbi:MAG: hypothetical protein AAF196_19765 [Planctomycetota bacterium]